MVKLDADDHEPTPKEKAWAVVRLILGLGQITLATISFYLLFEIGVTPESLGTVVATCLLASISVLLFRGKKS